MVNSSISCRIDPDRFMRWKLPQPSAKNQQPGLENLLQYDFIPRSGICFGCHGPRFFLQGRHLIQKKCLPLLKPNMHKSVTCKRLPASNNNCQFWWCLIQRNWWSFGFHRRKPVPSLRGDQLPYQLNYLDLNWSQWAWTSQICHDDVTQPLTSRL